MTGDPLVDLLLVRLTRDEEKEKVREFLVSELGMSEEEATKASESTPCMLDKPMPMEDARRIQEMIYPFIDLLPRQYGSPDTEPAADAARSGDQEIIFDGLNSQEDLFSGPDRDTDTSGTDFSHGYDGDFGDGAVRDHGEGDPGVVDIARPRPSSSGDEDDAFVITTASEEVRSIERCHVCGRTPTDSEKLAPCRTCGALTCGDCFDRIVHVCEKCATEGRIVDRPLKGAPEYRRNLEEEIVDSDVPDTGRASFRIPPSLLVVGVLVVLAALFFLIDPLGLLGGTDEMDPEFGAGGLDSTVAVAVPDTLDVDTLLSSTGDSVPIAVVDTLDSGVVAEDSVSIAEVDTTLVMGDTLAGTSIPDSLLISLRDLQLPEDIEPPDEMTSPRLLFSSPVQGIEVLTDSLPHLSYPLGFLSATFGIETDGISLIRTETGDNVLLISIMHPEPLENRVAFISSLGLLLDSTAVDQMVLYYLQSSYHPYELLTFVSDSFSVIADSRSPIFIQNRQAYSEDSWEILSGPVREWMLDLD